MSEARQSQSIQPQHRSSLTQTTWEELSQPGAYVEEGTGDLFRVPQEALVQGASPIITRAVWCPLLAPAAGPPAPKPAGSW